MEITDVKIRKIMFGSKCQSCRTGLLTQIFSLRTQTELEFRKI